MDDRNPDHPPASRTSGLPPLPVVAAVLDVALVVTFAAIGRASHAEGNPVTGALRTAAPFLGGLGLGWFLAATGLRRWPLDRVGGAVVLVATVAGGMLLRTLSDQGTAPSFVAVATIVLGVFLLGWRSVRLSLQRRRNT